MRPSPPPRLVQRWEGLEPGKQFVIAFPVLIVLISIVHWTALNQPLWRGALYGLFWAFPAAFLVMIASQNERRKRREAAAAAEDEPPLDSE